MKESKKLIIITGLSGGGKSTAAKYLEDLEFYCIDNIPPDLIPNLFHLISENPEIHRAALVLDIRNPKFRELAGGMLKRLKENFPEVEIWFFKADEKTLIKRFSETRRPHPLQRHESEKSLQELIEEEIEYLKPVEEEATKIIDTSHMTPHELKQLIKNLVAGGKGTFRITFLSFGFKYGIPQEADNVFDVRFLPNPHFIPELRAKTGMDKEVKEFILKFPETVSLLEKLKDIVLFTIPHYEKEGKSYLTFAIGCTGGQHRSVAIAELLAEATAKEFSEHEIYIEHREQKVRKKIAGKSLT
ncbi:RNase adapter RapZ [Desulfurobacterium sp.]